jgi:hypothetical protein
VVGRISDDKGADIEGLARYDELKWLEKRGKDGNLRY